MRLTRNWLKWKSSLSLCSSYYPSNKLCLVQLVSFKQFCDHGLRASWNQGNSLITFLLSSASVELRQVWDNFQTFGAFSYYTDSIPRAFDSPRISACDWHGIAKTTGAKERKVRREPGVRNKALFALACVSRFFLFSGWFLRQKTKKKGLLVGNFWLAACIDKFKFNVVQTPLPWHTGVYG